MDAIRTSRTVQDITFLFNKIGNLINNGNVNGINVNIDINMSNLDVTSIFIEETSDRSNSSDTESTSISGSDDTYIVIQPVANLCESSSFIDNDISGECCICLNEYSEMLHTSKRVLQKCRHSFCESCLNEWLKSHYTCPLCKDCLNLT